MNLIENKEYRVIESKHLDYKIGDFITYKRAMDISEGLHIVLKDGSLHMLPLSLVVIKIS